MNYIGLDIGTTGAKALLVDEKGAVLGKGYAGYELISDGCCVEQRAEDWSACGACAVLQAVQGQDVASIAAISLSTQGASTVAMDANNRPLGNALTWMDTRAAAEAAELAQHLGDDYIYKNTGWRVSPALDAAKIMYMKRADAHRNAVRFLSTLEYMNLFLTGNPVCDPSNSSIRQLYHVGKHDYDDDILRAVGVTRNELPDVAPTGALVGFLSASAAAATGLKPGTPVYNGAHDQYCASIGMGAITKGDMLLSAGTTWVVMGIDDRPLFTDTYLAPGVHPVPGLYGAIGSLVGSGASLQWFKNKFFTEDFEEINRQAALRADKMCDLFFYPYLSGANYPVWNLDARGCFTGLSLKHDRFDFARAIMEGAAFGVRRTLDDFFENGCGIQTLKIMGGAAKSPLWCSLIAAAANVPIEISCETEACALGAAIIAATGAGEYQNFSDAVKAMAACSHRQEPDPALVAALDEKYLRYTRMWDGIARFYQ